MLVKFWEGVGTEAAKRWLTGILVPALLFWVFGLAAWTFGAGGLCLGIRDDSRLEEINDYIQARTDAELVALILGVLAVVSLSAVLLSRIEPATLRFLQGYWPPGLRWLRDLRRAEWQKKRRTRKARFAVLQARLGRLSFSDLQELAQLNDQLHRAPASDLEQMGTKLGNVIRASELRPKNFYGLDTAVVWPRLWLLLDAEVKEEVTSARQALDKAVRAWQWSVLAAVWTIFAPYAIAVAVIAASIAYMAALTPARTFGDLFESCFDLYRHRVYEAVRWPLPGTPGAEVTTGEELTKKLWRGSLTQPPNYTAPPKPGS